MRKDRLKKRSFGLLNGTSMVIFCSVSSVFAGIEHLYAPMTESWAEQDMPLFVMYLADLVVFLVVGITLFYLMMNIRKGRFFTRQNYISFYVLGAAMLFPFFSHLMTSLLFGEIVLGDWGMVSMSISAFMFVMAEIFRHGYRLKEDHEMTI